MVISKSFCAQHLDLLFEALASAPEEEVRANILVALGDLCFRFPNVVEPYTRKMYARLTDGSARVRKNTMMVLTHLILHGMVKVRSEGAELALCLQDPVPRIRDLAALFFQAWAGAILLGLQAFFGGPGDRARPLDGWGPPRGPGRPPPRSSLHHTPRTPSRSIALHRAACACNALPAGSFVACTA